MSGARRRLFLRAATLAGTAAARRVPARSRGPAVPFAFALLGDTPYGEAATARFDALLRRLDADELACVIHVGDFKGGGESCDDLLYARRHRLLASSAHPLVLLPGDNDWTDCHRPSAGAHDPHERLQALRRRFFLDAPVLAATEAARAAIAFDRHPDAPENVRWRIGDVHFVGLHVVGSNDASDAPGPAAAAFPARRRQVLDWLDAARDDALRASAGALVIAFHANPGFARTRPPYRSFVAALRATAAAFQRPILLLHGDSHRFRVDRPLADDDGRPFAHVTRVECFGHPMQSAWVRIEHRPDLDGRFVVATRELPNGTAP